MRAGRPEQSTRAILLADDQAKGRSALRFLLEQQLDIEVLGEALNAARLVDWLTAACPDVVWLDGELPGSNPSLLSTVGAHCPSLTVIALSGRPEVQRKARSARVAAFVSKRDPLEQRLATIAECRGHE